VRLHRGVQRGRSEDVSSRRPASRPPLTYVLDASVAVAALRAAEPGHADALRRCLPLFAGRDDIVVPSVFDLEVTAALVRRGVGADRVATFFAQHLPARRLVTIGGRAVRAARAVVNATRLRAADALYVWVAAREDLTLVTADREIIQRAPLAGARAEAP
jgi:predicted nucleic acid-binding protein